MITRIRLAAALPCLALCVFAIAPARAQEPVRVTPAFTPGEWLEADAPIELRLSAPLQPGTGSLAVLLGDTDLTALFDVTQNRMVYHPNALPLPAGEHQLIVYHIGADGSWTELQKFQTNILTRRGFQQVSIAPKLALHNEGQVAEGHSTPELAPPRATFQDFTVNTGLSTAHVRRGFSVRTQANVVGVTERERALRYAQRKDAAPRFDLSDYLLLYERTGVKLSAGNVSFNAGRHLIQRHGSRGFTAVLRPLRGAALTIGALGGRPIVGWQQPFGIGESGSHMVAANLALEAFPARPGMLRLEATALDGALPATSGFNQGAITDREGSRGGEVSIHASDPWQRLTLDAGYTRSRFNNPPDPYLSGGFLIVPVTPAARDARHASLRANLVRAQLSPSLPATLTAAFRHERVAPLYRSVGASTRADVEENGFEVTGGLGPLHALFARGWAEDNLDRIPSILRTLTRSDRASLVLPVGLLVGARRSTLLPQLTYSMSRIHQYGDGIPENAGFQESHVPNQVSRIHALRLDWYARATRFAYALDLSEQDNRQAGRENADFEALVHTASIGVSPLRALDLGVDVSLESAESLERSEKTRNARLGGSIDLRPTRTTTLSAQASANRYTLDTVDLRQTSTDVRLQLSQKVTFHQRSAGSTGGQLFVRFARHSASANGLGGFADPRRTWTLNTGFTLSVF